MFLLNIQSKVPIFEQIENQITRFIETGVLSPGDRLPSVRQLAKDNGINPNTVAKAYAQLEQDGCVYNIPKKGVYVADVKKTDRADAEILLTMEQWKQNGISEDMIRRCLAKVYEGKE